MQGLLCFGDVSFFRSLILKQQGAFWGTVFWVWNQMSAATDCLVWHCKPAVVCGLKPIILSTKVMSVLLSSAVQWEQVHVVKKLLLTWWSHYIDLISTPDSVDPPKRNEFLMLWNYSAIQSTTIKWGLLRGLLQKSIFEIKEYQVF